MSLLTPIRRLLPVLALAVVALLLVLRPRPGQAAGQLTGLGPADGYVGDRTVTAFDAVPAVARLEPGLRAALQQATTDARGDGEDLRINSGWRSRGYQQQLLDRAVAHYGSLREARRWVNTPTASTHVSGAAVDVGPPDAARWLDEHGPSYGLCRVYENEPWHFELLTGPGGGCPALRGDAG